MVSEGEAGRYDLGVLVVHGIGNQKQGRTLAAWADSIVAWLNTWSPDDRVTWKQPAATVTSAVLRPEGAEPANLEMRLRFVPDANENDSQLGPEEEHQRWLFAEGWWAGTFDPPSFTELWSWSFMSVPATAAMHANAIVSSAIARYSFTENGWQKGLEIIRIVAMLISLLLLVVLSPLVLVLFTALFVAGLLASLVPIDALRSFVVKAQLMAIGTIGDTKRLTDSPTQAGAIKSPIVDGLKWLRNNGCERVVVLAHSQGAAVTYKALLDLADAERSRNRLKDEPGPPPVVPIDSFVTVGSGIPKVHALEHLGTATGLRNLRTASLVIPIAAVIASLAIRELHRDGALWTLIAVGTAFTVASAGALWHAYSELRAQKEASEVTVDDDEPDRRSARVKGGELVKHVLQAGAEALRPLSVSAATLLLFGGLLAVLLVVVSADRGVLALLAVLSIALGMLSVITIASDRIPPVDESLKGTGTRKWVDLYAGRDPVPAGPTRTHDDGWPTTWRVSNLGSLARDHNTYAANADECLTFVGVELLETAQLASLQADSVRAKTAQYGYIRRWRVGWRNFATWVLLAASALFAYRTWGSADDDVQRWYADWRAEDGLVDVWYPGSLPGWLPDTMGPDWARAIAALGYLTIAAILVAIGQAVWSSWDRLEGRKELGPGTDGPGQPKQFVALIGLLVVASVVAISPRWVLGRWTSIRLREWEGIATIVLTVGGLVLFGRLLPRLLRSSHLQEWVMSRYNTRVEAQLQFGESQLTRGQPEAALRTFAKAEEAARRADWGTRFAIEGATRAQALVHQHRLLTMTPYVPEAGEPDLDEMEITTRASFRRLYRDYARTPSARLLIAGANHNSAAGYPKTARRFLARVPTMQRSSAEWVAAAIAAYHDQRERKSQLVPVTWTDHDEIDPERSIDGFLQDQQLLLLFAIVASNGPNSVISPWSIYLPSADASQADRGAQEPITIRTLLQDGVRSPSADLRPFLDGALTADWTHEHRRQMLQTARWILGFEHFPPTESHAPREDASTQQPA